MDKNEACPLGYAYGEFFDLLEQPDQPAQLVSYDPQGPDTRPAGEYLVGTVTCLDGEKTGLPRRMYRHALENGLEFTGPAYAVYLFDAASTADAERCLLQIAVMVKKAEQI